MTFHFSREHRRCIFKLKNATAKISENYTALSRIVNNIISITRELSAFLLSVLIYLSLDFATYSPYGSEFVDVARALMKFVQPLKKPLYSRFFLYARRHDPLTLGAGSN